MAFQAFRGMKPFPQLMFAFFVALVSTLVVLIVGMIAIVPFFGIESIIGSLNPASVESAEAMNFLKYFQVLQSIGLFVVPPFIIAWLYEENIAGYLSLNKTTKTKNYMLAAISLLAVIPFINYIGALNSKMSFPESLAGMENWMRSMEDSAQMLVEKFMKVDTFSGLLFNIFMIAVLPALGEELMFRGVVQKIFTSMTRNYHWGIWISAFFFSAMHMQFYGFLPRMALGAMFGYLLVWTGSMWVPILAHFINNAMGTLGYFMINKKVIGDDVENWGTEPGQFYLVILSLAISGGLLYLIYQNEQQTKMPVNREDSQASRID